MSLSTVASRRVGQRVPFVLVRPIASGNQVLDRSRANDLRERYLEGHENAAESAIILDLQKIRAITSSAADALIVRWLLFARARRAFVFVVATADDAVAREIDSALFLAHETAFLVRQAEHPEVEAPRLIGERPEHHEELVEYIHGHPYCTANEVAEAFHIGQTAALNRLASLARRGLIFRQPQPGRLADLFAFPFSRLPVSAR